jgi:hypothetical protein
LSCLKSSVRETKFAMPGGTVSMPIDFMRE